MHVVFILSRLVIVIQRSQLVNAHTDAAADRHVEHAVTCALHD